jgi:hypothetical protein
MVWPPFWLSARPFSARSLIAVSKPAPRRKLDDLPFFPPPIPHTESVPELFCERKANDGVRIHNVLLSLRQKSGFLSACLLMKQFCLTLYVQGNWMIAGRLCAQGVRGSVRISIRLLPKEGLAFPPKQITDPSAGISEDIGQAAIALEARVAVLDGKAGRSELRMVRVVRGSYATLLMSVMVC